MEDFEFCSLDFGLWAWTFSLHNIKGQSPKA